MRCRSELDGIFRKGGTLRLQFPREDLGFSYAPPQPSSITAARRHLDASGRTEEFVPALRLGSRMPHARLRECGAPGACVYAEPAAASHNCESKRTCAEVSTTDLSGLWPGRHVCLMTERGQSVPELGLIEGAPGARSAAIVHLTLESSEREQTGARSCAPRQDKACVSHEAAKSSGAHESCWLWDQHGDMVKLLAGHSTRPPVRAVLLRPDGHVARIV